MHITFIEFCQRLSELAASLAAECPQFRVQLSKAGDDIWIRGKHCSGQVGLRFVDASVFRVDASFSSGSCVTGSLDKVREGLSEQTALLALLTSIDEKFTDTTVAGAT